jgi:hypothetical protein
MPGRQGATPASTAACVTPLATGQQLRAAMHRRMATRAAEQGLSARDMRNEPRSAKIIIRFACAAAAGSRNPYTTPDPRTHHGRAVVASAVKVGPLRAGGVESVDVQGPASDDPKVGDDHADYGALSRQGGVKVEWGGAD